MPKRIMMWLFMCEWSLRLRIPIDTFASSVVSCVTAPGVEMKMKGTNWVMTNDRTEHRLPTLNYIELNFHAALFKLFKSQCYDMRGLATFIPWCEQKDCVATYRSQSNVVISWINILRDSTWFWRRTVGDTVIDENMCDNTTEWLTKQIPAVNS